MSNFSSSSSGAASSKAFPKVVGIPRGCWCGATVVAQLSKFDRNPYRRFYRCSNAVMNKLVDDSHVFEWVDEALVNEVGRLENEVKELRLYLENQNNTIMETIEQAVKMKVEQAVKENVEQVVKEKVQEAIGEAKWGLKMTIVGVGVVAFGVVMKLMY